MSREEEGKTKCNFNSTPREGEEACTANLACGGWGDFSAELCRHTCRLEEGPAGGTSLKLQAPLGNSGEWTGKDLGRETRPSP